MEKMGKFFSVNGNLVPIKLHYFFFFGAMGGVVPYMPVLAKSLGINATAVGLVYTVLPFCVFFSKPIFGYLTDYFQNIKVIVFILVLITSVSYLSVLFIPSVDSYEDSPKSVHLICSDDKFLLYPRHYDKKCLEDALKQGVRSELKYKECYSNKSLTITGMLVQMKFEALETESENHSNCIPNIGKSKLFIEMEAEDNFTCDCVASNDSVIVKSNPAIDSCFCEKSSENSLVYSTYQFWVFTLLAVLSGTGAATVFCLSDAACYEVLGEHPELYGRQRLWATISWGIVTSLSGFLNDLATGTSGQKDYSPGFYVMLALVLIDVLLLLKIRLTKANFTINICQDVSKIFSSCETIIFALAVYVIGALTGLIWNYEFWFLQDLGAAQTLLGLSVAVQCLAAEVPFFFFSGWFIKTFGYFYCLSGSLLAFALRFMLYFILENPWLVLPIELLHGLTFALFYACMTGYASSNAPPGTEATMMGILGGLFEGLGVATGSLLGGVGFDKIGGRYTFLVAGVISFICVPLLLLSYFVSRKLNCEEACKIRFKSNKRYDGEIAENKM